MSGQAVLAAARGQLNNDLLWPFWVSHILYLSKLHSSTLEWWLYNRRAICSSAGRGLLHCGSNWTERREEETQMRSNSIPAPVLTARVLHLHSSPLSLCLDAFQSLWTKPVPLHVPPCMGCESSVERLLSLFYLSIHPSLTPLLLAPLLPVPSHWQSSFSSPSIILAHKTWGGELAGCVFRAGYTAMGALTRTNAIHASHLLARSHEKGWPRQAFMGHTTKAHHSSSSRAARSGRIWVRPASCQLLASRSGMVASLRKTQLHASWEELARGSLMSENLPQVVLH